MSKMEGHISFSSLDRTSAGKYYVYASTSSLEVASQEQQLSKFLYQPPREIPRTIGVAIPMKATFFISYIMELMQKFHIRTSNTAILLVGTRILNRHAHHFTFHHHLLSSLPSPVPSPGISM